tara:strand:+ start:937 stop:2151 length:1215 start_codon:yes stop_codon:yes gene_type:complete
MTVKHAVLVLLVIFGYRSGLAATPDTEWGRWLVEQVLMHPEVVSAREAMNASLSMADGLLRPIYNPRLGGEFEREGEANNFSLGISQTFDWTNKQGVRQEQATYSREAARQYYDIVLQQKNAEALQLLTEWRYAMNQAELALAQEAQLDTLINLVTQRQEAGDLGQIDVELTLLSLSQRMNTSAQSLALLRDIEARLAELLPTWTEELAQIPESLWFAEPPEQTLWIDEHPLVLAARADWLVLQQAAELAAKITRPDPTFGINAGEINQENLISLSFSIPLNIRNNYNAEARAATQRALAAEANYRSVRRLQQFSIQSAQNVRLEYQQRYERWQDLMQGIEESSEGLLEAQWNAGDISTTEYLLALQQRADGLSAGIELRTLYEMAKINWLQQTGQINDALRQL